MGSLALCPTTEKQSQPPPTIFIDTLLTSSINLDIIKTKIYFEFQGHLLCNYFVYN